MARRRYRSEPKRGEYNEGEEGSTVGLGFGGDMI